MNKFEFNEFFNQFINIVGESKNRLKNEAEGFSQNLKTSREIKKLESSIKDDYISIGLLVHELHKMDKSFDISNFSSKFDGIEKKKRQLIDLKKENTSEEPFEEKNYKNSSNDQEDYYQEKVDIDFESTDSKDEVTCNDCGAKNTKYVAYCINCGTKL